MKHPWGKPPSLSTAPSLAAAADRLLGGAQLVAFGFFFPFPPKQKNKFAFSFRNGMVDRGKVMKRPVCDTAHPSDFRRGW